MKPIWPPMILVGSASKGGATLRLVHGKHRPGTLKDAKEMLGELTSQLICWSVGNLSGGRRSWRLQLAAAPHRVGDSHMQNNRVMLPLLWHPIEGQITRLRSHAMLAAARNVERRR